MKKSVKIIIAIVAILVILGGIAAGLFFSGLFDYMKPARKAWNSQVEKALGLDGVKLTDYSETLEDYKDIIQKPFTANFDVSANVSISALNKDVQKTINESKIKIETASIPSEFNGQTKVTLESGDTKIIDFDVVYNKTKFGIGSTDLYDKYITASLEDLEEYATPNSSLLDTKTSILTKSKTSNEDISKMFENFSSLNMYDLLYVSKNDLKEIEKTYKKAFENSIDKDCYTKKANVKVEVDGKDVGTTAYYLTLSGKDAYDLVKGLAGATKDSDTIKKIITDKANMLLEAIGEDKIDSKQVQELLDEMYNSYDLDAMDEIWAEQKEEMIKEMKKSGIQIAVYSKFSKPVRLELNAVENMDDIYDVKTLISVEYAKKKDIYTINVSDDNTIVITDEYEKKSKDERIGTLSVEVKKTKLATIDYEFINKKAEKKLVLKADIPLASVKLNLETSVKGDIKKEPVDISISLDGTYKKESAKIMINGTIDYSKDVSIPTLNSSNSVEVLKLSEKEQNELSEKILKKASEILPDRLKKIGVNIKAEDIYNPKKTTKTNTISTNNMKDADDKLVAKKAGDETSLGKYTEVIEIGFKDKKVIAISVAMEFDDEKTAESIYTIMKMSDENNEQNNITQEGKRLVMHMDAKSFAEQEGISIDSLTKDTLKKELEKDGYTVE